MLFAAVAGVAGHLVIAVEGIGVDAAHHFQHFAGYYLFVLFIAGAIGDVAAIAHQACALDEGGHGGANFFRLQDLEIFWGAAAAATRFLSEQERGTDRKNYEQ